MGHICFDLLYAADGNQQDATTEHADAENSQAASQPAEHVISGSEQPTEQSPVNANATTSAPGGHARRT